VRCGVGLCGHTAYDVRVCVCVCAYMYSGTIARSAVQRAGMRAHGCGFACVVVVCVCRVLCRKPETSQSDASMHTAAEFCILVHPTTHTHDPSLFPMGCHKRTWQSVRAWGMLAWEQKNPRLMLLKGKRNKCWRSMDNSCKGWSLRPEEDRDAHLLALRPLLASSIDSSLPHPPVRNRFWWGRLAQRLRLEAYPLPARSDRCAPDKYMLARG